MQQGQCCLGEAFEGLTQGMSAAQREVDRYQNVLPWLGSRMADREHWAGRATQYAGQGRAANQVGLAAFAMRAEHDHVDLALMGLADDFGVGSTGNGLQQRARFVEGIAFANIVHGALQFVDDQWLQIAQRLAGKVGVEYVNYIEECTAFVGQPNGTSEGGTVFGGQVAGEQHGVSHDTPSSCSRGYLTQLPVNG